MGSVKNCVLEQTRVNDDCQEPASQRQKAAAQALADACPARPVRAGDAGRRAGGVGFRDFRLQVLRVGGRHGRHRRPAALHGNAHRTGRRRGADRPAHQCLVAGVRCGAAGVGIARSHLQGAQRPRAAGRRALCGSALRRRRHHLACRPADRRPRPRHAVRRPAGSRHHRDRARSGLHAGRHRAEGRRRRAPAGGVRPDARRRCRLRRRCSAPKPGSCAS